MTTWQLLLGTWTWWPELGLAGAAAIGFHLARFRLAHPGRTLALLGAVAGLAIALVSPVAALARGTLFSAHMLQHVLLTLVVPLLALSSIPPSGKGSSGSSRREATTRWTWAAPWAAGVGAMWIWHAPSLCNAAATSDSVRALQTVSLLLMGGAFWWPILGPRTDQRLPDLGAVAYLFTACGACTVLGVTIAFSPVEVCSAYGHSVDALGALPLVRGTWGLTPSVDQQLGGLLMWVPGCTVYASAILALVARFYREPHGGAPEVP
jgi:cytochrome c oxidase assembly factor CtaG